MKIKLAITALAAIVLMMACGKDKFTTVPQVKVKSISPKVVTRGNIIEFKSSYTDQEGDIDSVYIVHKWHNGASSAPARDTFRYPFDSFNVPSNTKEADIIVTFSYDVSIDGYSLLVPSPSQDTTATLGIVLVDKKGNRSDYKESDKIRLIK